MTVYFAESRWPNTSSWAVMVAAYALLVSGSGGVDMTGRVLRTSAMVAEVVTAVIAVLTLVLYFMR